MQAFFCHPSRDRRIPVSGARNLLLQGERQKFLAEEWPRVHATIQRLGLTPEELLDAAAAGSDSPTDVKER